MSYLADKPVRQLPGVDPAYLLAPGRPVDNQVVMIDVQGQSIDDVEPTLRARGLIVQVSVDPTGGGNWIRPGTVVSRRRRPGHG